MSVTIEPERTVTAAELDMWHWPPEKLDIDALVAKEATRLDRLFPGWENRVNINTLDITTGRNCILGQCAYQKVLLFWRRPIGYGRGNDIVEDDEAAGGGAMFDQAYFSNDTRDAWITEIKRRHA